MIYMWNNMVNKTKNKVKIFMQNKNNRTIATIALIIVCFFAFNLSGLLSNIFTSITNLTNELGEMKKIVLQSPGYEGQEGGSYQITKIVNWTAADTASLEFDIKTIAETEGFEKDIVFILDTSASMEGTRIDTLKEALKTTIPTILEKNINNKIGLIRFSSDSTILNELTNDEESLINSIDSLEAIGDTNYYSAFVNLRSMLSDYREVSGRELVVVFVTDGAPNVSTPNQKSEYALFKVEHPYATVYGVPYYSGINNTISELSDVTDEVIGYNEYSSLADRLIKASLMPEDYEEFTISEYIDSDYFNVTTNDIKVSMGNIKITNETGSQKVTWTIPSGEFKSGDSLSMTINLKVQSDKLRKPGLYTTSTKTEASLKLPSSEAKTINSTEVNSLRSGYNVIYDANAPQGCNASFNLTEVKYAFDTVTLSSEQPSCSGYEFKGWQVVSDVQMINDDNFIMPDNNIQIKGTWTQLAINKTMEGDVYEKLTLYKTIERQAVPDNIKSEYVTSVTGINFKRGASETNGNGVYTIGSTLNDEYPIHYFRGNVNNNVIFANYCWKIVRTTNTGGVKLIYNGYPNGSGGCDNVGTASMLSSTKYNSSSGRGHTGASKVGYMYNSYYDSGMYRVEASKSTQSVLNSNYGMESTDYYYSKSVSYNSSTKEYSLVSPTQYTWESNYSDLVGYYTCFSTSSTGTCENISYIMETSNTEVIYVNIYGGGGVDEADLSLIVSPSVTKNSDGSYTMDSPISVDRLEWYNSGYSFYSKYEGYFVCENSTLSTCTDMNYIFDTYTSYYKYIPVSETFLVGDGYTYSNGTYTLTDVTSVYATEDYYYYKGKYTCFDQDGSCTKMYYLFKTSYNGQGYPYFNFSDGLTLEEAVEKTFNSETTNSTDSILKQKIDSWYTSNMTSYTSYLEDTVWCNDRSAFDLKKNFSYKSSSISLSCRTIDSFTVSTANGNGALTYPVGTITKDEIYYAGWTGNYGDYLDSKKNYLYTGSDYWTMTPSFLNYNGSYIYDGASSETPGSDTSYVRPMVSLKSDIEYSYGNGTSENPYVIAVD